MCKSERTSYETVTMRSFTITAVLGLSVAAYAASSHRGFTKRQSTCIVDTVTDPNTDQINASIGSWFNDVVAVNAFLNAVADGSITDLGSAAQSALINAQDEPCQLATLSSLDLGVDAFHCAVADLESVFDDHVIANLNTIVSNPNDTTAVHAAVQDINNFRCCNVLSDATIIWLDSAADLGLVGVVRTDAPRENACSSITCTQACTALDNGSFGTVTVDPGT
ncbi:hypothetical protein LTR37_011944 [Vermiconidia calcicola]|uniref:Uncharacterized protein n=1 Tax=Vermiconidia calcicola TaxID=1690605 RepID=A0ACC3N2A8_9PEZI|nr:hypothetical protein LTR37_011944 [Vermiconidia calcicola]